MTDAIAKIIRIGTLPRLYPEDRGQRVSIFCRITYADGRLSIQGVEGPLPSGNALGGCGQIIMGWDEVPADLWTFAPGWDADRLARFAAIWNDYHLNDMCAGSPAQTAAVKAMPREARSFYGVRAKLEEMGLHPDPDYLHEGEPYAYGSAWLRRDVPQEALDFLRALPETDRQPAWV